MTNLQKSQNTNKNFLRTSLIACAIVVITGCSARVGSHGNIPDQQIVDSIRVGINNKAQVSAMLGSPSAQATFDQETWFYMGTKTLKGPSFEKDEVLERQVLIIRFNKQGIVQEVERLDKNDGQEIRVVERKTPTRGKELTVIEQFLGNIGRFGNGEGGVNRAGP